MKRAVSLKLLTTTDQSAALSALAVEFAVACNAIVPLSVEHRCWNRVVLHHHAYYAVAKWFAKPFTV
jgi:putative transposase